MPRRDGSGPDGRGPRTGRGSGSCSDRRDSDRRRPTDRRR